MRFDQTSENSFLNQILSYVKAKEKAVGINIGNNHTIAIGDITGNMWKMVSAIFSGLTCYKTKVLAAPDSSS